VSDAARAPLAIRITRPYFDEDAFLAEEADTLTPSSLLLLGAQSRPEGTILRFELALRSGEILLRGEGRVTAYKAKARGDTPGLVLRFTRLDLKSKQFLDRVKERRDPRKGISVPPAPPSGLEASGSYGIADTGAHVAAPPPPAPPARASVMPARASAPPAPPSYRPPPPMRPSSPPLGAVARAMIADPSLNAELSLAADIETTHVRSRADAEDAPVSSTRGVAIDAAERNALLSRLRARAQRLGPSGAAEVLARRS
jgi:hypothetical protein